MNEIVAEGLEVPEGPVVLADGRIAFVQQLLGEVSVFDGNRVERLAYVGGAANAVTLGTDGLYAAQNGGVVNAWRSDDPRPPGIQRIGLDGEVVSIRTSVAGEPLRAPNDLVFGPDGRLWFTDPGHPYDPDARGPNGRIIAIGGDRDEIIADVGPSYCNGIAFGVDGRPFWVESYAREVRVLGSDGPESVCILPEAHIPDGFAVAADGRLFIATVSSAGITVIAPTGELETVIRLDESAFPTNCCFDGSALWVTDFGRDHERTPRSGRLWRVETDAVGAALATGSIDPSP